MALSDKEKQRQFKERKYAAGYKQKTIWIPRNERKSARKLKDAFFERLEVITADFSNKRLSALFDICIKAALKGQKGAKRKE